MMALSASLFLLTAQVALPEPNRREALADKVSLTLTSARSTYYVGETVRLQLKLRNFSDAPVLGWFTPESSIKTTISYRHGSSAFTPLGHLETGRYGAQRWVRLDPEATLTHELTVAFDPSTQLPLLNEPGEYEFQAEYKDFDGPNGLLVSSTLGISVVDVPPDGREALAAYRRGLAFFAEFDPGRPHTVTPAQIQAGASFLEKYPGSLYWRDVLDGVWKAVAERSLSNVASESEEALLKKIREEWADSTPPVLNLSATPSSLWPPNQRLVPITVAVNVTDDQDLGPEVKLVSITCDDACDSAADIAGAAYDTDDRDFELRAERKGSGEGRTYTITYSATDSSGNTSSAATTVVVPHDQGVRAWSGDAVAYKVGDRVSHEGHTWRCFQAHRSQPDWSPPRTPALWIKLPVSTNWDYPVQYALDEEVTYEGARYRCRQAHTSQAGWTPPSTPALWTRAN